MLVLGVKMLLLRSNLICNKNLDHELLELQSQ